VRNGYRVYLSLTSNCNLGCPFCCMYSGTGRETFIEVRRAFDILDMANARGVPVEVQLEGGEPFTHPGFWVILHYALTLDNIVKVNILTNGIDLISHLEHMVMLRRERPEVAFCLKVSVNYWILKEISGHMDTVAAAVFAVRHVKGVDVLLNVRERVNDDYRGMIDSYGLLDVSSIYKLQSYGRLSKAGRLYGKPVIVQNIDEWAVYGSDGTPFGHDLIGRSEHERTLP